MAPSSVQPPVKTESHSIEFPLARRKELVTPVDRRAHGLLARKRGAIGAGEHPEAIVELLGEGLYRQEIDPRRRQFDR